MGIKENIISIKERLPKDITLIAVSKTKPESDIMLAYQAGHRIFGENKAQELKQKHELLPKDISWHFIGHLQENKIKYIIDFVSMIHSIDSLKLLQQINKKALGCNRVVDCLLEIKLSNEESKFGMSKQQAYDLLADDSFTQMQNVRICGVMGIGSITDNPDKTRQEFRSLKDTFTDLKNRFFKDNDFFKEISMGMSSDYETAIQEGSTMIRLGNKIFGKRDYQI